MKLLAASVEVNESEASPVGMRPLGALVIVVCGGVASTVKDALAGVGSTSPAALTARTSNVCAPSASAVYCCGLAQDTHGAPSRAHWKVSSASLPWKANVTVDWPIKPVGPLSITVSGGLDAEPEPVGGDDEPPEPGGGDGSEPVGP